MDFDSFTAVLLVTPPAPPTPSEDEAARLQDAHLAHLAGLHEAGTLMAAGPLADRSGHFRGLSILRCDADEARRLAQADPAVQAGVFEVVVLPWLVPAGALLGEPTSFPHSVADVVG